MKVIDYNGSGRWTLDAVLQRYELYARRYHVIPPRNIKPPVTDDAGVRRIYPAMECVIEGIEEGDPACAEIGVEFIQESASFPFGRILKANTARALRRAALTPEQKWLIRKRIVEMLCSGYLPREYQEYAKLARKIGLAEWLALLERDADLDNVRVRKYYSYFKEHAAHDGRTE